MLQSVQCKIAMQSRVSTLLFFFSHLAASFSHQGAFISTQICIFVFFFYFFFFFFFFTCRPAVCVHKCDAFQQITRSLNSDLLFNRSLLSLQWTSGPPMSYICLTCTISFCWSKLISDTMRSSISLWRWANFLRDAEKTFQTIVKTVRCSSTLQTQMLPHEFRGKKGVFIEIFRKL